MNTATFTQDELDYAEDRIDLLQSKGVPIVRQGGGGTWDPGYVVGIEMRTPIGRDAPIKYVYTWSEVLDL